MTYAAYEMTYRGTSPPTPIGTPSDPWHRPTVGSEVGAFPVSEVPLHDLRSLRDE